MDIGTILFNGARRKGLLLGGHLSGAGVLLITLAWAQKGWTPVIITLLLAVVVLQVWLHIVLKRIQHDLDSYHPSDTGPSDSHE